MKQIAAEDLQIIQQLTSVGFDESTAKTLLQQQGNEVVKRQLDWLDARKAERNRIGMLRKAIEEDWPMPASLEAKTKEQAIREKQRLDDERKRIEDQKIMELKSKRRIKQRRLLSEWGSASLEEREKWIQAAVKAEPSTMVANIIAKTEPEGESPHTAILNALAHERNLPPIYSNG